MSIVKGTYSHSGIWRPDVEGNTVKQLAGPCEVTALKLSAGAGAAFVEIYDGASTTEQSDLRWVLDTSTTDNDAQTFFNPLSFKRGLIAKLVQGTGNNPIVCISTV